MQKTFIEGGVVRMAVEAVEGSAFIAAFK